VLQKTLGLFLGYADAGFTLAFFPNMFLLFEPNSLSGPQ
jgi:hypothetical protein